MDADNKTDAISTPIILFFMIITPFLEYIKLQQKFQHKMMWVGGSELFDRFKKEGEDFA